MDVRISDEHLKKLIEAGFPKEELCLGVAEEILRRLPREIDNTFGNWKSTLHIGLSEEGFWEIEYHDRDGTLKVKNKSLADSAAKMWIHLKKFDFLPESSLSPEGK